MPGRIGRIGCVRSSAWLFDFSSTQTSTAFSGGARQSPTTSRTEQLITTDELRARMPHLRARQASLRGQLDALNAQAAGRDAYLKVAGNLEGFLAQVRSSAATAGEERQRVL